MKNLLSLLTLSILLVSCGKESGPNQTPELGDVAQPILKELGEGKYEVCFLNGAASNKNKPYKIRTKGTLTLESNGTGTVDYTAFVNDKDCTGTVVESGTYAVNHYKTILIDGVTLLEMNQLDITVWIPYAEVEGSFYMDLSHEEDESGGYKNQPTTEALALFKNSPTSFTKIR